MERRYSRSLTAIVLCLAFTLPLSHCGCTNPASFKKCIDQTRAEVDVCGINMTCKCSRQLFVIKCYEKCGDDELFHKMMLGEKGQRQIYCSQRKSGELPDLPIVGSGDGLPRPGFHPAERNNPKPGKQQEAPHPEKRVGLDGALVQPSSGRRDTKKGDVSGVVYKNVDDFSGSASNGSLMLLLMIASAATVGLVNL